MSERYGPRCENPKCWQFYPSHWEGCKTTASGSSVPEAARAAKAESDARLDRWFGAYCEAKALGGSGRAGLYRLMALADAEVAAAVAEERATTGRLRGWAEARIDLYADAPHNEGCEGEPECAACWVADLRAALASPGEGE